MIPWQCREEVRRHEPVRLAALIEWSLRHAHGLSDEAVLACRAENPYLQRSGQLRQSLADFAAAYDFARRLKTLRGLTSCEAIRKARTDEPSGLNP